MTNPRVYPLDSFRGGRVLGYTEAAGTFPVSIKEHGENVIVDISYPKGALVLYDDKGTIVGPIGYQAALDLAERVLDGDSRALCDTRTLLTLACTVVGFSYPPQMIEPAAVALEVEVSAHV